MPEGRTYRQQLVYERTRKGFLVRTYTYAVVRIRRAAGYTGLGICPRDEFYAAAVCDRTFTRLFVRWTEGGYQKNDRPTPDRIDTTRGYLPDNIRWLTYLDNVTSSSGFRAQQAVAE